MSLSQLSRILPLPTEDLQQILDYAGTLPPQEAANHFKDLLGESPQSIEFISSFNARRQLSLGPTQSGASFAAPSSASTSSTPGQSSNSTSEVPKRVKKKKKPLHALPPRQVEQISAPQGTAYQKVDVEDYIGQRSRPSPANVAGTSDYSTRSGPMYGQESITATAPVQAAEFAPAPAVKPTQIPRLPPSAAGSLISDSKQKSRSAGSSRTASPAPKSSKTKVNITGGTSMQGASTALQELDAAIRSLEVSTNPTLDDVEKRRCNCIAARHPLLAAAPNCINCGKVICVKEGLGPCTFCGTPLLSSEEIQSMVTELRAERGREKMALDAAAHRKADVGKGVIPLASRIGGSSGGASNSHSSSPALGAVLTPSSSLPSSRSQSPSGGNPDSAAARALAHRDKLLSFQAQNARRTTVHDEAADFETPDAGTSIWASPAERARQLKKQQQILAQQAWNARPEYEKRRTVVSIDLVGGKAVRRVQMVDIPREEAVPDLVDDNDDDYLAGTQQPVLAASDGNARSGGAFSRNPLLGSLVRPVYEPQGEQGKGEGKGKSGGENAEAVGSSAQNFRRSRWRRVQDDLDDNEAVILDGGVHGGR